MSFTQRRAMRLSEILTFLGLSYVSFSIYFSLKGFLIVAYILILAQFILDCFGGESAVVAMISDL